MNIPLIKLIEIKSPDIFIQNFTVQEPETWCIYGDNLSGIDSFVELFAGDVTQSGYKQFIIPDSIEILSFKGQQELFEEEVRNDDTDFLGQIDPGTLVREFLQGIETGHPLLIAFNMANCLELGYRQLSSGQCRKLLLLQKLLQSPKVLIIQNPYDGLDEQSCNELDKTFEVIVKENRATLLVFVSSVGDIPVWCTHLGVLQGDQLIQQGRKSDVLANLKNRKENTLQACSKLDDLLKEPSANKQTRDELICLRNGWASYGNNKLFKNLNLTVRAGDHTLITGPNGCGKSTLLAILTGDNPNCYANDLRILGKRKGKGGVHLGYKTAHGHCLSCPASGPPGTWFRFTYHPFRTV